MKLHEKIAWYRRQAKLSQEELAARVGVSRQAVSRWEMDGAVPEVDKLIADQAQSSDPTQRNDDMFQAFDIITQDVPYVFLYYPVKNIAMNKAYTGVTMNASWIWNIHFQSVHPVSEG